MRTETKWSDEKWGGDGSERRTLKGAQVDRPEEETGEKLRGDDRRDEKNVLKLTQNECARRLPKNGARVSLRVEGLRRTPREAAE